ncbi:MAG: hypothetical protein GTN79_01890 [Gammaproteobacteria bacterium]|nr:hypothetical protein [Gammaproteobacteria bacterium]
MEKRVRYAPASGEGVAVYWVTIPPKPGVCTATPTAVTIGDARSSLVTMGGN